jgi:TRAP-type C4-dicarboxylate transport system permease small subunit
LRAWLDRLYALAGALAAAFMIGTLVMVLIGIAGRIFGFYVRGTDSYAGYCMAACGFLALAYTLGRNEHIRVTLILNHVPAGAHRALEIWCYAVAVLLAGALAWFSIRLAWQSHAFNDVSTGIDATPLWIPQLAMAIGTVVLLIAFVDGLVGTVRGRREADAGEEPAHVE